MTYSISLKDEIYSIIILIINWSAIILAAVISEFFNNSWIYFISIIFIGGQQLSLGLHYHEVCHGNFFRSRQIGDTIGRLFMGWPLLVELDAYRERHMAHHMYVNTPRDPDYLGEPTLLSDTTSGWVLFISSILGVKNFDFIFKTDNWNNNISRSSKNNHWIFCFRIYIILAILSIFLTENIYFFLWYWVIPYIFVLLPLLRFRGITEHLYLRKGDDRPAMARNFIVGRIAKYFIFPKNSNLHLCHHLYPRILYYKLNDNFICSDLYAADGYETNGFQGLYQEIQYFYRKKNVSV